MRLPSLTLTGNWGNRRLDIDGDGAYSGPDDRDEQSGSNVFNAANEWTARSSAKTGGDHDDFATTYDAVGNLTQEDLDSVRGIITGQSGRGFVYDVFGRLVKATDGYTGSALDIGRYRYNGLGMRTMWQYDADGGGTLSTSERYYFMHDERWRIVATFRDQDATPKEAFVWHAAGGSGLGGSGLGGTGVPPVSSYIDSIILRDRDNYTGGTPNPMTSASDGTREERRFYCQNWRADVVAVTASDGVPLEYVRYSAYGEATVYPVADLNMDGVVDSNDLTAWSNLLYSSPSTAVYADSDLDSDGADDWASSGLDSTLFYDSYTENLGLSGKGLLSSAGIDNRIGYAGYQWDPAVRAYHVRYRVYLPDIGRWTRRDPAVNFDIYEYVLGSALASTDSQGLWPSAPPLLDDPATDMLPLTHRLAHSLSCALLAAKIRSYLNTAEEIAAWDNFVSGGGDDIQLSDAEMQLLLFANQAFDSRLQSMSAQACANECNAIQGTIGSNAPVPHEKSIGRYLLFVSVTCEHGCSHWTATLADPYDFGPLPWGTRTLRNESNTRLVHYANMVLRCGWRSFRHRGSISGTTGDCGIM